MKRRRSILRNAIIAVVFAVAFFPTLAIAVWEVLHGRGAVSYTNVYELAIPYSSLLIAVAALAVALAVAFIARLVYFWRSGHDSSASVKRIDTLAQSGDLGENK